MKKNLLPLFLIFILFNKLYSQTANNGNVGKYIHPSGQSSHDIRNNNVTSCGCWQTRDNTWSIAKFDFQGGSGGPGVPPLYRNDDWSTDSIHLPFVFCFYGDTITSVYINNNGNVSIGGTYATYTALSFPDPTYRMIAPFWSDVDTRDSASGVVYYKVGADYLIVQWDHVSFFNMHMDTTNTYQLILTNGFSSMLPETKNVGFCYQDMQWTTGDASGGAFGFGGTPATVGVNYGDGVNYLQIGLYDNNSILYDGPYGLNDGVKSLDNQSFVFNVCVNNFNVSPILSGDYICDTVVLCVGDTFTYNANFLSPEGGQITTVTTITHGLNGVNVLTSPGINASFYMSFVATTAGLYSFDIIGTDDGVPAATTTYTLNFNIQNCGVGIDEKNKNRDVISPNPFDNELSLSFNDSKNNITVTDLSGRIIFQGVAGQKSTLNTRDWRKGIYFISVKSSDKIFTQKIIKD